MKMLSVCLFVVMFVQWFIQRAIRLWCNKQYQVLGAINNQTLLQIIKLCCNKQSFIKLEFKAHHKISEVSHFSVGQKRSHLPEILMDTHSVFCSENKL